MTAVEILATLHGLGVTLAPWVDHILVDAPHGVLTANLRQAMQTHKAALLALVEEWSERAAIAEYCGGLAREEAERLAWRGVLGEGPVSHAVGHDDDSSRIGGSHAV